MLFLRVGWEVISLVLLFMSWREGRKRMGFGCGVSRDEVDHEQENWEVA